MIIKISYHSDVHSLNVYSSYIMKYKKEEQQEGPACACGRGDLYEAWLKNEKTEQRKKSAKKEQADKSRDDK
jgi:hypothetical protein